MRALDQMNLKTLVVAGGVGANAQLRNRLQEEVSARGGQVFFPPPDLCTDNGAMIALAGLAKVKRARSAPADLAPASFSVHPRWSLAEAIKS